MMNKLPDSISTLPEHSAWVNKINSALVNLFVDVHALLTSPEHLQLFRGLPFHAVRTWAANDALSVDSENSVAVALTVWAEGEQGSQCTEAQQKELSGLLRVRHLSTGAQCLCRGCQEVRSTLQLKQMLPLLRSFPILCAPTAWLVQEK